MAVAPVLAALAACGDPNVASGTDPTTPATTTPDTTPGTITTSTAPVIAHPVRPDDVVLKLSYEGGFVAAGYAFVNTPALLVSGEIGAGRAGCHQPCGLGVNPPVPLAHDDAPYRTGVGSHASVAAGGHLEATRQGAWQGTRLD